MSNKTETAANNINNINICRTVVTASEFLKQVERASSDNCRNDNDNFRNIEISNVRVENKSLARSAEFNFSKLANVTFVNVDLERTEWNYAELENVTFSHCKLDGTSMNYAAMTNVTFDHCFMNRSEFDFASGNITFTSCNIHGMELHHTLAALNFDSCSGEAMELNYCPNLTINAENCDFHRAEFVDSHFNGTLKNCILTDSDWYSTDATELAFINCGMREINLAGSVGVNVAGDNANDVEDDDDFDLDFE